MVTFNPNGTVEIIRNVGQVAVVVSESVQDTQEEIIETNGADFIHTIVGYGAGIMQGAVGSFNPACTTCDPQPTDEFPQRLGQFTGSGAIAVIGIENLFVGLGGDGAAFVTGQVEVLPLTIAQTALGAYLTINSATYITKAASTSLQMIDIQKNTTAGRPNKTAPVSGANGPHTTVKKDPSSGKISGTETWTPNSRNPSGFDSKKRVDLNPKGNV